MRIVVEDLGVGPIDGVRGKAEVLGDAKDRVAW
jgi:hypothetical protein